MSVKRRGSTVVTAVTAVVFGAFMGTASGETPESIHLPVGDRVVPMCASPDAAWQLSYFLDAPTAASASEAVAALPELRDAAQGATITDTAATRLIEGTESYAVYISIEQREDGSFYVDAAAICVEDR